MSESVIYDARFLCDARLSSLRASSHCLNLHPSSPWPRPWTQTSPSAKTPFAALIEKQPADCIRLSDYLLNSEVSKRTCVFERSVVFARLTGKPEKLRCGEDFIWESLLSQGKSARHHKGSKSQPVILGFFMFLSYSITEAGFLCFCLNDHWLLRPFLPAISGLGHRMHEY